MNLIFLRFLLLSDYGNELLGISRDLRLTDVFVLLAEIASISTDATMVLIMNLIMVRNIISR